MPLKRPTLKNKAKYQNLKHALKMQMIRLNVDLETLPTPPLMFTGGK